MPINLLVKHVKGKTWSIYCYLDESFDFLIKKLGKIPNWIMKGSNTFYPFLSGYADAEGCWNVIKDGKDAIRFTFYLASCDKIILQQIRNKLEKLGYTAYLRLMKRRGETTNLGVHNKDYFVVVSRKQDVISLAEALSKLSHHEDKINKMKLILDNKSKKWSELKVCH